MASTLHTAFRTWASVHGYKVVTKLEAKGDTRLTQSHRGGKATGEWTVEVAWPGGSGLVCEGVGRNYPVLSLTAERAIAWLESH